MLGSAGSLRADEPNREYQVKAAFIYNFAQFIQWPDKAFSDSSSPFVVGVIGQDPFGENLEDAMRDKTIAGRPVEVRHMDSPDQIPSCHLLFIPASEDDQLDDIFKWVADRPILTIGETPKFLDAGGTIQFLIEDGKIRFAINPDSAARAGLRISSKLMSLARIYKKP
ncbi:MAG: YfiR family protein [Tepidisphaeraceae bacterium]